MSYAIKARHRRLGTLSTTALTAVNPGGCATSGAVLRKINVACTFYFRTCALVLSELRYSFCLLLALLNCPPVIQIPLKNNNYHTKIVVTPECTGPSQNPHFDEIDYYYLYQYYHWRR